MRAFDFAPWSRSTVGFDRFFQESEIAPGVTPFVLGHKFENLAQDRLGNRVLLGAGGNSGKRTVPQPQALFAQEVHGQGLNPGRGFKGDVYLRHFFFRNVHPQGVEPFFQHQAVFTFFKGPD